MSVVRFLLEYGINMINLLAEFGIYKECFNVLFTI